MASNSHQFIVDFLKMKMNNDGYIEVAFEGKSQINFEKLKLPPKIYSHRPDIIAINLDNKIAIGEAKTKSDFSTRTTQQIFDYNKICNELENKGIVYLGIPESVSDKYNKFILENKLNTENFKIITLPDHIVDEYNDEHKL